MGSESPRNRDIRGDYIEGKSTYTLAEMYGMSHESILKVVGKKIVDRNNGKIAPEEEKKVYEDFCGEFGIAALRKKYHRSKGIIKKVVGKYNLFGLVDLYSKCVAGVRE